VRSLRFLVSRRWLLFLAVVVLLAYACLLLGRWQWHRLESKKANNAIIRTNESAAPVPVDQMLREGRNPDSSQISTRSHRRLANQRGTDQDNS